VIDLASSCPVETLEFIGNNGRAVDDVAIDGLGTDALRLSLDMTNSLVRDQALAILDDVVVAAINVRGSCVGGPGTDIAVGTAPFFPATTVAAVPRLRSSGAATIRQWPTNDDTEVVFSEASDLVLLRADGTTGRRSDLGDIFALRDVGGVTSDYDIGRFYLRGEFDEGFVDEDLQARRTALDSVNFSNPTVGAGTFYEFRVDPFGDVPAAGIVVFAADGTSTDFTVEGIPLAASLRQCPKTGVARARGWRCAS
jgi:hypothetical protein